MKKYNRIFAAVCTAVTCIGLLGGCGSDGAAQSSGTAADLTEETSGGAELSFIHWDANQQAGMQAMADDFMKNNPDIKIKVEVTPWDEYWTKLQASATGGSMPDVFWMHPEKVYTYVEGSALMDLTDKIADSNIDLSNYPKYIGEDFNVDGSQWAIPKDYSTMGLWYNKDLFDAAGVSYPDDTWTWDDWYEAAGKLTDTENGIYGMLAQCNSQDYYYNLIFANGSDIIDEMETDSLYDETKTIEAIEYAVSFIEAGYAPSTADLASTTALQYFESGRAAMLTAGSWYAVELTNIDGLNCDVAPLPKQAQRGSICGGMGYSIAANTKYPEEAWKFVEYLGSYEANVIQAESGAAISAFEGSQDAWVKGFPDINAQVFVDAQEYGYSTQYCQTRVEWTTMEEDIMAQVFSGAITAQDGCMQLAAQVQEVLDEHNQ